MELKDFIATALIEICEGISLAKKSVENSAIAPASVTKGMVRESVADLENIKFEIAVTVEDSLENTKNKSIGIMKVLSANINNQQQDSQRSINVHKITFSVPFVPAAIK